MHIGPVMNNKKINVFVVLGMVIILLTSSVAEAKVRHSSVEKILGQKKAVVAEQVLSSPNTDMFICPSLILGRCDFNDAFGWRIHPKSHRAKLHMGIDLGADSGSMLFAPADGKVVFKGRKGGYGKAIIIDHGYGWQTKYAHLSEFMVKEGQTIHKGDLIGFIGSTGVSTGPHLHFEIIYAGVQVDPVKYFAQLEMLNTHYAWANFSFSRFW